MDDETDPNWPDRAKWDKASDRVKWIRYRSAMRSLRRALTQISEDNVIKIREAMEAEHLIQDHADEQT